MLGLCTTTNSKGNISRDFNPCFEWCALCISHYSREPLHFYKTFWVVDFVPHSHIACFRIYTAPAPRPLLHSWETAAARQEPILRWCCYFASFIHSFFCRLCSVCCHLCAVLDTIAYSRLLLFLTSWSSKIVAERVAAAIMLPRQILSVKIILVRPQANP